MVRARRLSTSFPPASPGAARRLRIWLVLAMALAAISLGSARPASAHATFDHSDPAPNATLPASPGQVRLWFTEPLEHSGSTASLYDAGGKQIAGTRVEFAADPMTMTLALPPSLPPGVYTVAWQTLSAADGHELQGYFAFNVGAAATTQTAFAPVQNQGAPGWLQAAARWLALLGLAVAVAIWPIWLLVLRPAAGDDPVGATLARRAKRFAAIAIGAAVAGDLAALLVQATTLGATNFAGAVWTTLSDTRYGRLWLLRIGLLAAYALTLRFANWEAPRRSPLLSGVGLLLAALAPIPFSLNTHAAAEPIGAAMAVAADVVHLLGAAVWAGGLIVLLVVLLPALRGLPGAAQRATLARALPRFSAIALVAWAALGLTGLYSAWLQVGSLDALRATDYGLTLVVKLALLAPVLVLAAINLLVATPRLQKAATVARMTNWTRRVAWTIGGEVALVTLVLLVVGRLTSLEPARAELAAQQRPGIVLPMTLDPGETARPATLTITPGAAGPNRYRLEVAGAPLPAGSEAVARFSLPALGIGTKEVALTPDGGSTFTGGGSELAIAGTWTVETVVRKIGAFSWDATQPITVSATPPAATTPPPGWVLGDFGLPGLALLLAGFVASVLAWRQSERRGAWSGIAAATLAAGAILLFQARIVPASPVLARAEASPAVTTEAKVGVLAPAAPATSPTAAAAAAGTPVTRDGLTATLLPAPWRASRATIAVSLANQSGAPVTNAAVTAFVRSLDMDMGATSVAARETAPGRYEAADVPLTMSGQWRLTIRVAPRGQASTSFVYDLDVNAGATPRAGASG